MGLSDRIKAVFTQDFLNGLFPPEKADEFFDAIYGGTEEGAFDISLRFASYNEAANTIRLEFCLTERPGKCMACSLTSGLPPVFERHPIIDIKGIIERINKAIAPDASVDSWTIGSTTPVAPKVNVIPLILRLKA